MGSFKLRHKVYENVMKTLWKRYETIYKFSDTKTELGNKCTIPYPNNKGEHWTDFMIKFYEYIIRWKVAINMGFGKKKRK